MELFTHSLLTGHLQPVNRQSFKQCCESAAWLRPWELDCLDPMLGTIRSWRRRVQDRLVLTGVQVPPLTFRLMIVQPAFPSTFWAGPKLILVIQVHSDSAFAFVQLQFHSSDVPRRTYSQNLFVKLAILHLPKVPPSFRLV